MGHAHDHAHDHDHGHGHDDAHAAPRETGRRRLAIALALTATVMVAEAVGGWIANSQALLADAGHMLSDAGALALALAAMHFATRKPTGRHSYGWLRLEILAALANGVVLVLIAVAIFYESAQRLSAPPEVDVPLMLGVAAVGLVANLVSAIVLRAGHDHGHGHERQLNVHAAYMHVLSDLLGSVGAIAAGAVMYFTGWRAADPIAAALVGVLILWSAVRIVRQATDILLEGVPAHIDLDALASELRAVEGVRSVHDVHVWTISSGIHLMTCHAVVGDHGDHHEVLERLSCLVRERFKIDHSTIQLECEDLSPKEAGTGFCDRR